MRSIFGDLSYAWRQLVRSPGLTAAAVLSLALGIGANVVVFSWVHTLILHPLPGVSGTNRLVVFTMVNSLSGDEGHSISYMDALDLAEESGTFELVATHSQWVMRLETDLLHEWIWAQPVAGPFFDVLGVKPALGRFFDAGLAAAPEVVISHRFWRRAFGGDPRVLGRSVRIDQQPHVIVGVAAPSFEGAVGGLSFDLWLPAAPQERVRTGLTLNHRGSRWLYAIGRLQPHVDVGAAQAVTRTVSRRLAATFPDTHRHRELLLRPLWQAPYGAQGFFMPVARILGAIAALLLLLILTNLASLQLARATTRGRELAIRHALGAPRRRIVRQLLTEAVLLGLLGGALGTVLAFWGVGLLRVLPIDTNLPVRLELGLDTGALLLGVALAVGSGVLFGLAPALRMSSLSCDRALRAESRTLGTSREPHRLRSALVVVETALATLVLVGAGLCLKSFREAQRVQRGFDPENVAVAPLALTAPERTEAGRRRLYRRVVEEARGLPSVESVALVDRVPLGPAGLQGVGLDAEGYEADLSEDTTVRFTVVSPGYLTTLGIPLIDGRGLAESDDAEAAGVAVVNQALAHRYWLDGSAVGRRVRAWGRDFRVVGVARDWKVQRLSEVPEPLILFSYRQVDTGPDSPILLVKSHGDPSALVTTLERRIQAVEPTASLQGTMPMSRFTDLAIAPQRIAAALMFLLGGAALLLASLGIFGVLAFVVSQRTGEYGVRIAIGATPQRILGLVLGLGLERVLAGLILGLALAGGLSPVLAGFLISVAPTDIAVYASVAVLVTAVGALASYLPARKAVRVDPISSLRGE